MPVYSLSDIVYQRARKSVDPESDTLRKKTIYGSQFATNIIRVSCNNICELEGGEICELIYNAIDASGVTNNIGKFGFGFYSILGIIYGNPSLSITIDTTYFDENFKRYKVVIKEKSYGDIVVLLEELMCENQQTGTTITIKTDKNLSAIQHHICHTMKFFVDATIGCEIKGCENEDIYRGAIDNYGCGIDENGTYQINRYDEIYPSIRSKYQDKPKIDLLFDWDNSIISITDFGTGICPNILFNTMLVPSISSKGIYHDNIKAIYDNQTATLIGKHESLLHITVGGVTVYRHSRYFRGVNLEYIVSMPKYTTISLARNDIIIDDIDIEEIFTNNILKLINDTIDITSDLTALWLHLKDYMLYTKVKKNKHLVNKLIEDTIKRTDLLFASGKDIDFLIRILNGQSNELKIVKLPGSNLHHLEQYVLQHAQNIDCWNYSNETYWNKHVFILSDVGKNITSAGFSSLLFVNKTFVESNTNWIVDLSLSYQGDRLYPTVAPMILEQKRSFLNSILDLSEISPSIRPFYHGICSIYVAMLNTLNNFGHDEGQINIIFKRVVDDIKILCNGLSDSSMNIYIRSLYLLFSSASNTGKSDFIMIESCSLKSYDDEPQPIDKDLDVILWLNDLCIKLKRCYFSPVNMLRESYKRVRTANRSICDFFDENSVTPREELIMREVLIPSRSIRKDEKRPKILSYLLQQIRTRYTEDMLTHCFDNYVFSNGKSIEALVYRPLWIALDVYNSTLTDEKYRLCPILPYDNSHNFTGKQVFNMLFHEDNCNLGTAHNYSKETEFQIFDAITNTGTTKDYISAVLTELIQNSLDAIRISNNTWNFISLGFSNEDDPALYFKDFVGIEPKNLVYLLVPFLSSKIDNKSTGFMGTGLFNIYRQPYCKRVLIQTVTSTSIVSIECTPIISNSNVTDILYSYNQDNNTKQLEEGTTFIIYLNGDAVLINDLFVDMKLFVNSAMMGMHCGVLFNEKILKKAKAIIHEDEKVTIYRSPGIQSYIFTNGVPSHPMIREKGAEIISCGFILDIKLGNYKVKQSRNNDKTFDFVPYFDLMKTWGAVNDIFTTGVLEHLMPFVNYQGPYDQCGISSLCYFLHEKIYFQDIFADNSVIYNIIKINNLLECRTPTWFLIKSLCHKSCDPLVVNCVWMWFKNKTAPIKQSSQGEEIKNDNPQLGYIKKFIDTYWAIGSELESKKHIVGTNFIFHDKAPAVFLSKLESISGCYKPSEHAIFLDENSFDKDIYIDQIELLLNITDDNERIMNIREYSEVSKLFSITNPMNTLLHELTHAHRKQDGSCHELISLILNYDTPDEPNVVRCTFDEGGALVASLIAEHGLYSKFLLA